MTLTWCVRSWRHERDNHRDHSGTRPAAAASGDGYMPLPATGKGGLPKGWPNRARTADAVNQLHRTHEGYDNTGIRCDGLAAIDIDILDPAVVESIELTALLWLGVSDLRRVGRAPKKLLLFRCAHSALRKTATRKFVLNGEKAQVEILAGNVRSLLRSVSTPGPGAHTHGQMLRRQTRRLPTCWW